RQVAIVRHAEASFTGAAAAVLETLRGLGVDTSGAQLFDGSGLSRKNRLSADMLARLVYIASKPSSSALRATLSGLPVAGFSGTLRDRFGTDGSSKAVSDVRAKTGSLTQVRSLAGMVTTADGAVLSFAVVANGFPNNGGDTAERGLDQVAAVMADCGCR
ncbi:MAG: D-alanyl-D-alanine carboxypeptidase, partial [Pseudonocardiaceae bacterium]